jgi:pheromone shutdown protein TraB
MPSPNDSPELESDHPRESNDDRPHDSEVEDPPDSNDDPGAETARDESPADDPRMNDEFVRTVSRSDGDVTLVGVVHDHPASVHRVRAVVRERDPAVVALESPPLAVPLYETYARDSRTPPAFGGEMSAAARAAAETDAEVVGIDAPTPGFFARLVRNCRSAGASLGTLRQVAAGVASVSRHALTCRVAAAVADRTALRVEVDDPVAHDCSRSDPPAVQASDERAQARRSQSLLRAFDPPRPIRLRDETREECMADELRSLRERGETVAVVGLDHLDGVAEQVAE